MQKECFEKDDEYIEHEQSPTHFESSDEDEDDKISLENLNKKHISNKTLDRARISENNSRSVSSRKQKTIKTNPNSFKINVLEANKEEDLKRGS